MPRQAHLTGNGTSEAGNDRMTFGSMSESTQTPPSMSNSSPRNAPPLDAGATVQQQSRLGLAPSGIQTHFTHPWDNPFSNSTFTYYMGPPRTSRNTGINTALIASHGHDFDGRFVGAIPISRAMNIPRHLVAGNHSHTQNTRPHFRGKAVCILNCLHCENEVCRRGMRAILLADMNIELFSTDSPPVGTLICKKSGVLPTLLGH